MTTAATALRRAKKNLKKPTLLEVKSIVKKATRKIGETKHQDFVQSTSFDNLSVSAPDKVLTSETEQSLLDTGRIGDKVRPVYLHGWQQVFSDASTPANQPCRMLVVQGHGENGTIPVLSDILQTTATVVNSPYNIDNRGNFTVLHDSRFNISSLMYPSIFRNISCKVPSTVNYIAATTSVASGGIYAWHLCDAGSNGPACDTFWRLKYKDV